MGDPVLIRSDVQLHADVPIPALAGLLHLGLKFVKYNLAMMIDQFTITGNVDTLWH